jgi:hypothetical protein
MRLLREGGIHRYDWGVRSFWTGGADACRTPCLDFTAGQHRLTTLRMNLQRRSPMSADTKTPLEHVNDTVVQLKEMRHYAKNNVELLTTQWLLFDGELSKLQRAEKIEQLMTLQGQFYDALEEAIADLEGLSVELQPPPPEE